MKELGLVNPQAETLPTKREEPHDEKDLREEPEAA
jgi:hypothetical protein